METSTMHSLVDSVRAIAEAHTMVLKGLKAFAKDESMLDDLENDLQNIGLKPKKDYVLNIKKGTLEVAYLDKQSKHIDNIKRIYRLKENVNEQQLHEATAKLMAQRAITDIFIQSKDIANTFEQFSMKLSTAMQEHVAEFIAEYLQEHIDDVDDLK